ncbi:MAG: hypothetical protein LBE22_00680 [Azoarcus sp.]|jgi:hypothetical protein|nr:hypothetical protein [Azoarcus sp.]
MKKEQGNEKIITICGIFNPDCMPRRMRQHRTDASQQPCGRTPDKHARAIQTAYRREFQMIFCKRSFLSGALLCSLVAGSLPAQASESLLHSALKVSRMLLAQAPAGQPRTTSTPNTQGEQRQAGRLAILIGEHQEVQHRLKAAHEKNPVDQAEVDQLTRTLASLESEISVAKNAPVYETFFDDETQSATAENSASKTVPSSEKQYQEWDIFRDFPRE